ncbi:MAG: hypothetical protein WBA41_24705 [Rivularia sp. (in: cyanobacteria)]
MKHERVHRACAAWRKAQCPIGHAPLTQSGIAISRSPHAFHERETLLPTGVARFGHK